MHWFTDYIPKHDKFIWINYFEDEIIWKKFVWKSFQWITIENYYHVPCDLQINNFISMDPETPGNCQGSASTNTNAAEKSSMCQFLKTHGSRRRSSYYTEKKHEWSASASSCGESELDKSLDYGQHEIKSKETEISCSKSTANENEISFVNELGKIAEIAINVVTNDNLTPNDDDTDDDLLSSLNSDPAREGSPNSVTISQISTDCDECDISVGEDCNPHPLIPGNINPQPLAFLTAAAAPPSQQSSFVSGSTTKAASRSRSKSFGSVEMMQLNPHYLSSPSTPLEILKCQLVPPRIVKTPPKESYQWAYKQPLPMLDQNLLSPSSCSSAKHKRSRKKSLTVDTLRPIRIRSAEPQKSPSSTFTTTNDNLDLKWACGASHLNPAFNDDKGLDQCPPPSLFNASGQSFYKGVRESGPKGIVPKMRYHNGNFKQRRKFWRKGLSAVMLLPLLHNVIAKRQEKNKVSPTPPENSRKYVGLNENNQEGMLKTSHSEESICSITVVNSLDNLLAIRPKTNFHKYKNGTMRRKKARKAWKSSFRKWKSVVALGGRSFRKINVKC